MKNQAHWSNQKEVVHTSLPIRFTIWLTKHLPHWFMIGVAFMVSVFYYLFGPKIRKYCKIYQKNLQEFYGPDYKLKKSPFKQIYAFAISFIEKIEYWLKELPENALEFRDDDYNTMVESLKNNKGAYLICSHLGSIEILRSIAYRTEVVTGRTVKVLPIMDVDVNSKFVSSMQQSNSHIYESYINASDIGVGTLEMMQNTLDNGSLIFCAGDRTGSKSSRTIKVPLFGKDALFPYGTFFIPSLLETDVYFMFNMRSPDFKAYSKYKIFVYKAKTDLNVPRSKRKQAIEDLCKEYVSILEDLCKQYPYQWFNFFDFWNLDSAENV